MKIHGLFWDKYFRAVIRILQQGSLLQVVWLYRFLLHFKKVFDNLTYEYCVYTISTFPLPPSLPPKVITSFSFFIIYFYLMCIVFYLHTCLWGCQLPWSWSYRQLWTTMWLLGIELRTSGRAASALNRWAISPAPLFFFLKWDYYIIRWNKN